MNEQLQCFLHDEFGRLDILLIDKKPYFPAIECAEILGYKKARNAVSRHCDHALKRGVVTHTKNQHGHTSQQTVEKIFIPEGDLYRLIVRSKLPDAERFERWVFDEVLPSIRKHGAYINHNVLVEMLSNEEFSDALLENLYREQQKREEAENQVADMTPKALYYDSVLQSKTLIPVTLIAKDYGMSAAAFNNLLHGLGIQFKVGGAWILYQRYAGKGYTSTRTHQIDGRITSMHTCWTQKGRFFLYEKLGQFGIIPCCEASKISV